MVVRLSEGREAVQAYVDEQVALGHRHILDIVTEDNVRVFGLIGDLTEEEAITVTPADEWRVLDAMKHMVAVIPRSRDRLQALSSGQPFEAPPPVSSSGTADPSFSELRAAYIDGMTEILSLLRAADPAKGLDVTADHPIYGTYNWLGWAVFSHHVHTHDHIGQIENIRKAVRPA
ncbi:MAG TPA: DinB family protein [Dehalococcoidia bacterium]|jgi:hypothetical protein|nr:DinB family protein [Dehalococcoidia bacterium]